MCPVVNAVRSLEVYSWIIGLLGLMLALSRRWRLRSESVVVRPRKICIGRRSVGCTGNPVIASSASHCDSFLPLGSMAGQTSP